MKQKDTHPRPTTPILLVAPTSHHLPWLEEHEHITHHSHQPDLLWIDETPSIRIETIRDLISWTTTKPYASQHKTIVITHANRMTLQAQNALLKTLEEPPIYVHIVLTTNNEYALLSTIVSRCQVIRVSAAQIQATQKRTAQSYTSQTQNNKTDTAIATIEINMPTTYTEAIRYAEQIGKDKEAAIAWCEEVITTLSPQLHHAPSPVIVQTLRHASQTLQRLKKNVNVKLTLESMFFSMIQTENPLAKPEHFV